MRRIFIVFALTSCSKGLPTATHPPHSDARRDAVHEQHTLPTPVLGRSEPEPARIGPPLGNGAGSRRVSTRDDAATLESSARLAEMDSASSLHRE